MKLVYKLGLILLFVGVCFAGLAADNLREYTKAIKREFDISPNGTTSISNKYGKVDVKTWNRNRVKIDVTIMVDASSESKAQEVFDRIDVAFSNSATSVKAVTTIEPRKKGFWDWAKGDTDNDYSINYEVFLPPTNNLELSHKYGDAFVAGLSGKVTAEIKYANLKLEGVGDDSHINLAYGNGSIARAEDLMVEVSYAKMNIQEVKDVQVTSKYTKLAIDQAADIRSSSKYDDYNLGAIRNFHNSGKYDNIDIESAENVEVSSRYSQVNAGQVDNTLDLDLQYGGARTGLGQNFREASLVGNYTDFKLNVASQANYQMDAAATYAGIVYPRALTVTYELEKGSSHEVKGHHGAANASAVIKARLSYGGLKITEQ
jgi:hypothetical protein